MDKRAQALEETRLRILEATMQVHDEQGMADAKWADIARRAGVSLATMYRYFRSNDELIEECGKLTFAQFPPPDPTNAAATFAGLSGVERLHRLVAEVYGYYERTAPMMEMARRDLHRSTAVAEGFETIRAGIEALVQEALIPFRISKIQRAAVFAFLDDRAWQSFIDAGMKPSDAKREASALLSRAAGLSSGGTRKG